jgi:hypothetical protein
MLREVAGQQCNAITFNAFGALLATLGPCDRRNNDGPPNQPNELDTINFVYCDIGWMRV